MPAYIYLDNFEYEIRDTDKMLNSIITDQRDGRLLKTDLHRTLRQIKHTIEGILDEDANLEKEQQ